MQSLKTLHQMSRQGTLIHVVVFDDGIEPHPEYETHHLIGMSLPHTAAPTHDAMRQLGLLQTMLGMLKPAMPSATATSSKHPMMDYESVMVELTKVVANLASNNTNRQLMGESGAIKDLLRLLDIPNDEIKENLLRTIMNLSIATENEDRIRDEGGLSVLLEIFQDQDASPALLLQTVRVLVNLSCNGTIGPVFSSCSLFTREV